MATFMAWLLWVVDTISLARATLVVLVHAVVVISVPRGASITPRRALARARRHQLAAEQVASCSRSLIASLRAASRSCAPSGSRAWTSRRGPRRRHELATLAIAKGVG